MSTQLTLPDALLSESGANARSYVEQAFASGRTLSSWQLSRYLPALDRSAIMQVFNHLANQWPDGITGGYKFQDPDHPGHYLR